MDTHSEQRCFGGVQSTHSHPSTETGTSMRFGLYLPPAAEKGSVPAVYYLAGLTCTEETGAIKAGFQRTAAELGLAIVFPDTSPRGLELPKEHDDWDFGSGAGFYVDALQEPWRAHYRMESYVARELRELVESHFPVINGTAGILGHSMGGHGALTLALKYPDIFVSVSAFAPVCAPTQCPWGEKAFGAYLGSDPEVWKKHDATELVRTRTSSHQLLVDQGLDDPFLERELKPELLEHACHRYGQPLTLRRHAGYDHSYWFIQTFAEDHLRHHAKTLLD